MSEKLNRPRVPRRFYVMTLMIFVPVFFVLVRGFFSKPDAPATPATPGSPAVTLSKDAQ